MITEKQQDLMCRSILLNFLESDRSKVDFVKSWLQTLDHSQASPIIDKIIRLDYGFNIQWADGEWSELRKELKHDLESLGMPFIQ